MFYISNSMKLRGTMKSITLILSCFVIAFSQITGQDKEGDSSMKWDVDNVNNIAGFKTEVYGSPEIIKSEEYGNVIWFNGIDDGLIVDSNPLERAENFTIEVIFKPDSTYPENFEQRFVHIQDSSTNERRVLIELRMTEGNKWYLDTFIKADANQLTLVSPNDLHPAGVWTHAALVYENGQMTHYVNGMKELSGTVKYLPISNASTSIGMRMNKVSWFKGSISFLKFTHKALIPGEFCLDENMK